MTLGTSGRKSRGAAAFPSRSKTQATVEGQVSEKEALMRLIWLRTRHRVTVATDVADAELGRDHSIKVGGDTAFVWTNQ